MSGHASTPAAAAVMYHGSVRRLPFEDQVRAAALAGCGAITIGPWEYRQLLARGIAPRELVAIAGDAGVRITHIDPIVTWVPDWQPTEFVPEFPLDRLACGEDELYAIAEALGLQSMTLAATYSPGSMAPSAVIDFFGAFCGRAARHGLRCDLEFVPFSPIADLAAAWRIVDAAGAPNSGIMFDFWHFVRSGSELDLLRSIPGDRITGVQISDGPAVIPPGKTLVEETMTGRMPVGRGAFPICGIVQTLDAIGGLNNVGPEIFAEAFDSMSAGEIAAECRASLATIEAWRSPAKAQASDDAVEAVA